MRHRRSLLLGSLVLMGWVVGSPNLQAQQGYFGRTSTTSGASGASRGRGVQSNTRLAVSREGGRRSSMVSRTSEEPDPLARFSDQGRSVPPSSSSSSAEPPARALPSPPPIRRNYYPDMRVSQFPNGNLPTPRSHCSPGRHQLIGISCGTGF